MVLKQTFPLLLRKHKNPSSHTALKIVNYVKKEGGGYSSCFAYHSQRSSIESVEVWIPCIEVVFCSVMRSWRRRNGQLNNNTDWICLKYFTVKGAVESSITVKLPEEILHSLTPFYPLFYQYSSIEGTSKAFQQFECMHVWMYPSIGPGNLLWYVYVALEMLEAISKDLIPGPLSSKAAKFLPYTLH